MIKWKYKSLIITEFGSQSQSPRFLTVFPSKNCKFIKNLHQQNSLELHQFFIISRNSCCFLFHRSLAWTVLRNHHHNHQDSQLFIIGSSMANCNFSQLEWPWANLSFPIIFPIIMLYLFWGIARKGFQIHHCHHFKVSFRISWFLQLLYAYYSSCNVDQHARFSFWFGEL